MAALVPVADEDRNAGAGGPAFEDAGKDLRRVRLVALRDDAALAGTAAGEVGRQVILAERETGRTAVDDDEVSGTVRLPAGGNPERLPEAVARHLLLLTAAPRSAWSTDAPDGYRRCAS